VATYSRERPGMSAFRTRGTASCTTPIPPMRADWTALWGMYQWLDRAPRGAQRKMRASGGAATTSTTSAEPSRGCRWRNGGTGDLTTHGFPSELPSEAFFGVSALLFAGSAAVTIVWCASMSAMGEMPMPGGWTMSMGVDADAGTDLAPALWRRSSACGS